MRTASTRTTARLMVMPAAIALMSIPGTARATDSDSDKTSDIGVMNHCPSHGRPSNTTSCTSLSSGEIWHLKYHPDAVKTRIATEYKKESGGAITAKLGYNFRGTDHWGSTFTQEAGTTKRKTWDKYDYDWICNTTIGLLSVTGQGRFQTPTASC